ncbi:MAG: sulfur carrier protein ThiS [Alphaproteobacteria bacterium]|jgi:thiamine biosynthesis protein ThiS|nr:sulfur carrier protein ThiS [Alphaproteobacteria bacterium]
MQVTINGETRVARQGDSVETLLQSVGLVPQKVAVERNGEIVPRSRYAITMLADGDRLEVVQFVGGG